MRANHERTPIALRRLTAIDNISLGERVTPGLIYTWARRARHVRSDTNLLKQLSRARLIWLVAIVLVVLFVLYRCTAGGDAAPEYQTAVAEKRQRRFARQHLGQPAGGGHRRCRQPGVGPHPGAVRRLQFPGEEGRADRQDRSVAVPGRGGRRPRPTSWRRAPTSRGCTVTAEDAERQAKRASEVFEQRLISETERDNAVATARSARAVGGTGQGPARAGARAARAGAHQPALHRHPLAHRWRGDLARGERGPDRRGVAAGAGHLHHRAGPAEDGSAYQRRRVRHRPAQAGHARVVHRRCLSGRAVPRLDSRHPQCAAGGAERGHLRRGHRRRQSTISSSSPA